MAEQPTSAPEAIGDEPTKFREWMTSTVLIVFTVAVGLLCIMVLSCTLTQTRISSIVVDGININIWKLDDVRAQWARLRDDLQEQSEALVTAQEELDDVTKKRNAFDVGYRPKRTELDALIQTFMTRVSASDPKLIAAMQDEGPVERVNRIEASKDDVLKAHPELQSLVAEIVRKGGEYKAVDQERIKIGAELNAKKAPVTGLETRIRAIRTSIDGLFTQFSTKPLDDPSRTRVENTLYELSRSRLARALILTPPDILTLALVILMGVLGSALQMTHALFKRHRIERAGAYFLRLSVGAITALVIFIVAKAGVPVIADASRLGGDAPINPYFVSFLAIISGLMSENAILSVQTQGARFFAPETPPDQLRWARFNLREAFAKANRNPENVKRLLNVEDGQFDAWISGKEPMPSSAQTMIAGVLEMPRRDLFTDLPPDELRETLAPAPAAAPAPA